MTRTIDMTPTWPEACRMLLIVLENGTDEGKADATKELLRMAEIAQAHVAANADKSDAETVNETKTTDVQAVHWPMSRLAKEMGFDDPMARLSFRLTTGDGETILPGNAMLKVIRS